jgi:hypothetical protein
MSPEEAVSDYILRYRAFARVEMQTFEKETTLRAAIRRAALCLLPDGRRHPHQYRIPKPLLEEAEVRLQAIAGKLQRAADFAALHGVVEAEMDSLYGIAALTVYDIAHRIGAYLKKAPELVYLHRGTKAGAAVFGLRGVTVDAKQLPTAFPRLTPAEIEDCLCIYKDQLRGGYDAASGGRHQRIKLSPCPPRRAARMVGCKR